jgi:hypothetical protein
MILHNRQRKVILMVFCCPSERQINALARQQDRKKCAGHDVNIVELCTLLQKYDKTQ